MTTALYLLGWVATGASLAFARSDRARVWRVLIVGGNGLFLVADVLDRNWVGAAVSCALIAFLLGTDWWKRGGKKAAREIGAKSRAVLAAVIEKARDAGTPLPEGAGA